MRILFALGGLYLLGIPALAALQAAGVNIDTIATWGYMVPMVTVGVLMILGLGIGAIWCAITGDVPK